MRLAISVFLTITIIIVAVPALAEPTMTIEFSKATKLTPNEMKWLRQEVEKAWPNALHRVVEYTGNQKTARHFKDFHILIRDSHPRATGAAAWSTSWATWGNWRSQSLSSGRQGITIFAPFFLLGHEKIEDVMVHEMLHVVLECSMSRRAFWYMSTFVVEGISYHADGSTKDSIDGILTYWNLDAKNTNFKYPKFSADDVFKSKDKKKWIRRRAFVYCFENIYGAKARTDAVRNLTKGKYYKTAFERSSKDKWDTIKDKCDECMKSYIDKRLKESGPYEPVFEAVRGEDHEKTIELGHQLLTEYPDSVWAGNTAKHIADAYYELEKYDDAIKYYTDVRNNVYKHSYWFAEPAKQIVLALANQGKCEQAQLKRQDFSRLHPSFWHEWKDEIDEGLKENCQGGKTVSGEKKPE